MAKKVILNVFLITTQRQARSEHPARTTNITIYYTINFPQSMFIFITELAYNKNVYVHTLTNNHVRICHGPTMT
jgi:hypothetical protein